MIEIKPGTKFIIDSLKEKYDIGFFEGKIYEYVGEDSKRQQTWKVDGKEIKIDRYDSFLGFPWYLRQIYEKEQISNCIV